MPKTNQPAINIPLPQLMIYEERRRWTQLTNLGYSEEGCAQLVKNPMVADLLISNYPFFNKPPYSLTLSQVEKIARKGVGKYFDALRLHTPALLAKGYKRSQIVDMAQYTNCDRTLPAVIKHTDSLLQKGLSHKTIAKIASRKNSEPRIVNINKYFYKMRDLGFSINDIVRIAKADDGADAFEVIVRDFAALRELGFTIDDMVVIACAESPRRNLYIIIKHYPDLQDRYQDDTNGDILTLIHIKNSLINLYPDTPTTEKLKYSGLPDMQLLNPTRSETTAAFALSNLAESSSGQSSAQQHGLFADNKRKTRPWEDQPDQEITPHPWTQYNGV